MRIAIIHHQYKLQGGMETYLCNLINEFNRQKDDVSAFVYKYSPQQNLPTCNVNKQNLTWLPRVLRKYWFALSVGRKLNKMPHDLTLSLMRTLTQDMIICGGTHLGFLKSLNRKPSLLDRLEIFVERKSYAASPKIIAHSKMLQEELTTFYKVDEEKIRVLYPPVDVEKFNHQHRSTKNKLRAKYNISPDKLILLFPSTGHKRKGFYALRDAMLTLPEHEFELIVAGNSPNNIGAKNIKYVGFVANMAELYCACDVTILPSLYEPFGLVVTESLACGTPVIISKFVGAKDFVTEEEGLIIDNVNMDSIRNAILELQSRTFSIEPFFAEKHNLLLKRHINLIKQLHRKTYEEKIP